jgi:hypothetical protein
VSEHLLALVSICQFSILGCNTFTALYSFVIISSVQSLRTITFCLYPTVKQPRCHHFVCSRH